jgi:hypothetical protein
VSASKHEDDFHSELKYHQREWVVQRIGWGAMVVFIGAAALGVFGHGIVSDASIGDASVATIKFERFARHASPARIEIAIAPAAAAAGMVSFEVNESYLNAFEVQSIVPEPRKVETHGERLRFTFDARATPSTIMLAVVPEKIGRKLAVFKVADRELRFEQFIYP